MEDESTNLGRWWDRLLTVHASKWALVATVPAIALFLYVPNGAVTLPIKLAFAIAGASYWVALGAKTVHELRRGLAEGR